MIALNTMTNCIAIALLVDPLLQKGNTPTKVESSLGNQELQKDLHAVASGRLTSQTPQKTAYHLVLGTSPNRWFGSERFRVRQDRGIAIRYLASIQAMVRCLC